ncbi:MAG: carbohydrate kinase [Bacteroidetes bacterium]|nr:MAG: carbohydrate kinase [Bacteroidota bacterium]
MLLLGIDLGTSAVKVSVINAESQHIVASASYPETEAEIISLKTGWAEQSPDTWWENVKQAVLKCNATAKYNPKDIGAIGIAYQMHGLVLMNSEGQVLRNAIIWCDSRAVALGKAAFEALGAQYCLQHLLNSPGNFTASKLAWVKQNEPAIYEKIHRVLLPGDFIAFKMTGDYTTTISALSEGVFWDFRRHRISPELMQYYGFDLAHLAPIKPVFDIHGFLKDALAAQLNLTAGIPVAYKAGDQPNNALALNVLQPGEVAATAGTSGVIYGVSNILQPDPQSRINNFAHVNYAPEAEASIGVLLCINGTGIFNRWIKNIAGDHNTYAAVNERAAQAPTGANGLLALPFGNGAERILNNKIMGGQFLNIDFNIHSTAHMLRAAQEGIAFSLRYGLDIMRENGIQPRVVRAGKANLFLSDLFAQTFASTNNVTLEFYEGDGSFGAAIGAGIGAKIYASATAASAQRQPIGSVQPRETDRLEELYQNWKAQLQTQMANLPNTTLQKHQSDIS